jgi:outer membrane protein assembly factor BamB
MHPHRPGLNLNAGRSRILASVLSVVALTGATACGAATTSPATSAAARIAAAPSTAAQGAKPAVAQGDWPGFRGDATRSAVGLQGPTGNPVLNWRVRAGGAVPDQVAIVGDVVYFTSDDSVLHAVSRTSGADIWKQSLKTGNTSGPLVADARIYLVDQLGVVRAFDAASGSPLWASTTRYSGTTQPISTGASVYLGSGDGFLVAIDPASGTEQWKVKLTPSGALVHNPAAADGMVYAGTDGGGFVAVDAATHQVAWTADLHGDNPGTAVVSAGVAYIATGPDSPTGTLHAFDAKTGTRLWDASTPLLQSPTILDGTAFSATTQGLVEAMDTSSGALRWSIQLTGKIRPMAVVGTTLYLDADQEHRVYAVETTTGHRLWQFDVDGGNDCCIAVAKGAVYAGTLSGSVYSIGGDGAQIAAVPFGGASASAAPASAVPAISSIAATTTWTADLRDLGFHPICQIAVDPSGRIWAPEADGNRIAIYGSDGKLVEQWGGPGDGPGQFDFTRQNQDGYGTLAFARDGSFFVLDVGNRRVQHFDAKRRFLGQWGGFGTDAGHFSDPVGIAVQRDGTVWVLDDRRSVVEHYDQSGKVLGSFDPFANQPVNDGANSLAADAAGNLYVTIAGPARVAVFDPKGAFQRFVGDGAFNEQPTNTAIDSSGRLFVTQGSDRGSAPGVLVFGPDGRPLGGFGPVGDNDGELVFPAGISVDGKGGLYVEDAMPDSARLVHFALPAALQ